MIAYGLLFFRYSFVDIHVLLYYFVLIDSSGDQVVAISSLYWLSTLLITL